LALSLQQERGKIIAVDRVADLAQHLAAVGFDDRGGVAFERISEGVVGGEKEPGIAAGLYHRLAGAMSQRPCVIDPVNGVGIAFRSCEVRRRRASRQEQLVFLAGNLAHGERDTGIHHLEDHVDLFHVKPGVDDVRADIRLVLMIGTDDLDLDTLCGGAEIFDRQLRRRNGTGTSDVRI
jgi:hypothetical protein